MISLVRRSPSDQRLRGMSTVNPLKLGMSTATFIAGIAGQIEEGEFETRDNLALVKRAFFLEQFDPGRSRRGSHHARGLGHAVGNHLRWNVLAGFAGNENDATSFSSAFPANIFV